MSGLEYIDIEQFRRNEIKRQIPLIIFLIGIGITGTIGNILVYLVYKNNYPSSNCRSFVLVLSVVDLCASLFGIPLEIAFLFREYNLHEWMCKASLFVNAFPTFTSGYLLLAIAIDRYRKVCKPFSWQISHSNAKWMCLLSAILGLACSWISPLIHGIQNRKHAKYNITISECVETDAMKQTVFPLLNTLIFIVLFVVTLAAIIVMYCFIAVKVKRHHDRTNMLRSKSNMSCKDKTVDRELNVPSGIVVLRKNDSKSGFIKEYEDSSFCNSNTLCGGIENSNHKTEEKDAKRQTERDMDTEVKHAQDIEKRNATLDRLQSFRRGSFSSSETLSTASRSNSINQNIRIKPLKHRNKFRTVFIMFLISLAFVISYLPLLCLLLIGAADETFVISLKDGNETAYKFFLRSYLINCACNPVIYGLCDKRFRKHYKKLICKWKNNK